MGCRNCGFIWSRRAWCWSYRWSTRSTLFSFCTHAGGFTSGGGRVSAGGPFVWLWTVAVGPLGRAGGCWPIPSIVTSSRPGMEDSCSGGKKTITNREVRWCTWKASETERPERERLTLASKMHRVVSICCMRREMLASFCGREKKHDGFTMMEDLSYKKKVVCVEHKEDAQTSSHTVEKRLRKRTVCTTNWLR